MPTGPDSENIIPIVEETVRVGTRPVERDHLVIHKIVTARDEVVELPLNSEELEIERVLIERAVDAAPQIRQEGDLLIIPVLEERLVVEKRLILIEEVRVRRLQKQCSARRTVRLRREQVVVSHEQPDDEPDKPDEPDKKESSDGHFSEHS